MSPEEQQRAVLKIVPLGTPRVEVVEKLKGAGIQFSPGTSESIYYCDVWNREDGAHWQMDVALLFDSDGKLYQTRRAQADTGLASAADTRAVSKSAQPGTKPAGAPLTPGNAASQTAPAGEPAARSRTPFQKRPDAPTIRR